MITPELISYIQGSLKIGKSKDDITSELKKIGWNDADIAEGFSKSVVVPVAPVQQPMTNNQSSGPIGISAATIDSTPKANPVQATQPQIMSNIPAIDLKQDSPAPQTTFKNTNSPTFIPSSAVPDFSLSGLGGKDVVGARASETPVVIKPAKRFRWYWALILVLLLAGGGITLAAKFELIPMEMIKGLNPFAKPPYTKENVVRGAYDKLKLVKQAKQNIQLSFRSTDRAGAKEYDVANMPEDFLSRDSQRIAYAHTVFGAVQEYFNKNGKYPPNISILKLKYYGEQTTNYDYDFYSPPKDKPKEVPVPSYVSDSIKYNSTNTTFKLSVTLESKAAINAILNSATPYSYDYSSDRISSKSRYDTPNVNGQTITLTEKTYPYFYSRSLFSLKSFITELNQTIKSMPTDMAIRSEFESWLDRSKEKLEGSLGINFEGSFGGISYAFIGELMTRGGDYYVKVDKIPAMPWFSSYFDPTAVQGKWINISEKEVSDIKDVLSYGLPDISVTEQQESQRRISNELISEALTDGVLVATSEPVKADLDGKTAYSYDLSINPEALPKFYSKFIEIVQRENKNKNEYFPIREKDLIDAEDFNKFVNGEAFKHWWEYNKGMSSFTAWFDRYGQILEINFEYTIVPDAKTAPRLAEKKYIFNLNYELANINEPRSIDAPSGSISADEAYKLVTGRTLSEDIKQRKYQKAMSGLSNLKYQLDAYKKEHGDYGSTIAIPGCPTGIGTQEALTTDAIKNSLKRIAEYAGEGVCVIGKSSFAFAFNFTSDQENKSGVYCIDNKGYYPKLISEAKTPANSILKSKAGEYSCRISSKINWVAN